MQPVTTSTGMSRIQTTAPSTSVPTSAPAFTGSPKTEAPSAVKNSFFSSIKSSIKKLKEKPFVKKIISYLESKKIMEKIHKYIDISKQKLEKPIASIKKYTEMGKTKLEKPLGKVLNWFKKLKIKK